MRELLAELLLMRALKPTKSRAKEQTEAVLADRCILPDCTSQVRSRGLCERHRQMWYAEFRSRPTVDERVAFEASCIREGLILASGQQEQILRARRNPFAHVQGAAP